MRKDNMKPGDEVKFKSETTKEKEYREARKIIMKVVWVDEPRVGIEALWLAGR